MCGICGVFNAENSISIIEKCLDAMKERGKDGRGIYSEKGLAIGHNLLAIVGHVKQPFKAKGSAFAANCEIYNWRELAKENNIEAKNDAELCFKLLDRQSCIKELKKAIECLDGDYAICFLKNGMLYLIRDIIGIKPLFYAKKEDSFAFASEKKALDAIGFRNAKELNPREILAYSLESRKIRKYKRKFFSIRRYAERTKAINEKTETINKKRCATKKRGSAKLENPKAKTKNANKQDALYKGIPEEAIEIADKLICFLSSAVKKRIPEKRLGILFSGGLDSSVLALICKKLGKEAICYSSGFKDKGLKEPEDIVFAKKAAKMLGLKLKTKITGLSLAERYLKKALYAIEDTNVVKAGVALAFYPAFEMAKKDNIKVMLSGLGSEEIFAGYQRHRLSGNINKECLSGLLKLYERDLYRDDVIAMQHGIELRLPFLDKELIKFALNIAPELKIKDGIEKYILRVAALRLGLPEELAWRKKRAAQYGSRFNNAIAKLAKKAGYRLKSAYLASIYPYKNLKLAVLASGGKDSIYAAWIMHKQNYELSCFITIHSKNKDSYMFHTPAIDAVALQAKAASIAILEKETKGKKEEELKELEEALEEAKKLYKIDGVVTGALFSSYQRDRIEAICDKLGLKIFSPLWHIEQEAEIRGILKEGFEVIITKIAADGLDKSWLGKKLDKRALKELIALNKKLGINIAGEGGEYESFVLDCPLFKKRIIIKEMEKKLENEFTGTLYIKRAELEDKKASKLKNQPALKRN